MTISRQATACCFWLLVLFIPLLVAQNHNDGNDREVTLLGLGHMGSALCKCLAENGYNVHTWNRGIEQRNKIREMHLETVVVYDTAQAAIEKSNTILLVINSEPQLKSVRELIEGIDESSIQNKTLVNFVNQEPFATQQLEEFLASSHIHHVAGQLFAVPQSICSPGAIVLASSPTRSSQALAKTTPLLQVLGRVETFFDNVGYAPLVIVALIQTLYFGLTGYELSLLVLHKYGAPLQVVDTFVQLSKQVVATQYFPGFMDSIARQVSNRDWKRGVPAKPVLELMEMHGDFLHKMGIVQDIYNTPYVKYLSETVRYEPDAGQSAVIKHYNVDGYSFVEQEKTDEL